MNASQMNISYNTPEDFATAVVKEARKGLVNGTFEVAGSPVGIKAHGLWVQRIQASSVTDGGDFKTREAMREYIVKFCTF